MDRLRVRNNDEHAIAQVHSMPLGESEVPIFAKYSANDMEGP
jgi:hypothetical protein